MPDETKRTPSRPRRPARRAFVANDAVIDPSLPSVVRRDPLPTDPFAAIAGLPEGPGVVEARAIGPRLRLVARDRRAGLALLSARVQLGSRHDAKRSARVHVLDLALRRGVSTREMLAALLGLFGVALTYDAETERRIARYEARLDRQQRPIPRSVWVEPAGDDDDEIVGETAMPRSAGFGFGA